MTWCPLSARPYPAAGGALVPSELAPPCTAEGVSSLVLEAEAEVEVDADADAAADAGARAEVAAAAAAADAHHVSSSAAAVLVHVKPQTGRTHQIRVHLAHAALPILSDPMYGPHIRWGGAAPSGNVKPVVDDGYEANVLEEQAAAAAAGSVWAAGGARAGGGAAAVGATAGSVGAAAGAEEGVAGVGEAAGLGAGAGDVDVDAGLGAERENSRPPLMAPPPAPPWDGELWLGRQALHAARLTARSHTSPPFQLT